MVCVSVYLCVCVCVCECVPVCVCVCVCSALPGALYYQALSAAGLVCVMRAGDTGLVKRLFI